MKSLINYSSRFRILKGGKISLVVSALLGNAVIANAAPTGGTVTSGSATISQSGTTTIINQSTSKASINWTNFSIDTNEVVNFNQPSSSSITLNRVIGNEKSIIDGALNANGQVWILNSNGILFNSNARVNTAGILATTAELSDADFNAGNYNFKNATSDSVINLGTIEVSNAGSVVLASNEVVNEGTIKAVKGKVHLVGADSYSLNLNGNSLVNLTVDKGVLDALVSNSGNILADGGEIYLTTNAVNELLKGVVNNTGIIEANSIDGLTGKVELFAHGGIANVSGTIEAKDGFIETSGENLKVAEGTIVKAKTWLLDPTNITVDSSGSEPLSGDPATTSTAGDLTVSNTTIQTSLNGGTDVTLQATNDITINSAISKTAGADATLTLEAGRHININADITSTTGELNTVFLADNDSSGDGINTFTSSNITTNGGDVTFGDGTTHADGYLVGGDLYISSSSAQTISTNGGDITVHGETLIANTSGLTLDTGSSGGNITFNGVINSANQYDYVASNAIYWTDARTAALSGNGSLTSNDVGYSYLVSIGSRLENAVAGIATGYVGAWIGAYRDKDDVLGNGDTAWYWADSPDNTTPFFYQGGSATSYYNNFASFEPNGTGTGGEYAGQFFGTAGQWNDLTSTNSSQGDPYSISGYVKETNLANSSLTINTGTGNVTFSENVGTLKALDTLTITANQTNLPSAITTQNVQTYNGAVKLVDHTTLTTTNSDLIFNGTVDSTDALNPKNLITNILADNTYYWVDWTSSDTTHVYGTITIGGTTIDVTFTKDVGFLEAQTDDADINYWTGYQGAAFTNGISPYISQNVANGPTGGDIIQLSTGGSQTLTFSESVENLAFSVVSMNGGDFAFNQDFNIESYTGYDAGYGVSSQGYYGIGTMSKSIANGVYTLTDAETNGTEPHGTIRFTNAFSELTWTDVTETWHGFTVGVSGASADAGKVQFNGLVGNSALLGDIDINGAMQTTADIKSANSLDVSGFSKISADITTVTNQNYQSAIELTSDSVLTTTSNGSVTAVSTIDGAYELTINTNGTGDTSVGYSIGGTTKLTGLDITTDVVNLNGINVADNSDITIANRSTGNISDVISGTGVTFTKDETGTLILTGDNTYTGATTISGGTLQLGNAGTSGNIASTSSLVNNGTLAFNRSDDFTFSKVISGTGNVVKDGSNTLTYLADATYTGSTTINNGTLQIGNGGTTGSIESTSNVTNNGTLKYYLGEDRTVGYSISGTGDIDIVAGEYSLFGNDNAEDTDGFLTSSAQTIATNTTVLDVLERLSGVRMNGNFINNTDGDASTDNSSEAGIYFKEFDATTNSATFQAQFYNNVSTPFTKTVFVKLTQSGNDVQAQYYTPDGTVTQQTAYISGNQLGSDFRTLSGVNSFGDGVSSVDADGYGIDKLYSSSKLTFTADNTYSGSTTINNTVKSISSGTAWYERKLLGMLSLGNGGTTGGLDNTSNVVNDGVLFFNRSNDNTLDAAISGTGNVIKENSNVVTISGAHTYTGYTTIDNGTLVVQQDSSDTTSSIFNGDGELIIQPNSDDFSTTIDLSDTVFATSLTGLTIGKSSSVDGTNDVNVILGSSVDINGPISVYGGNIYVNENIDTQGGTTAGDVLLKASGDITLAASKSITTDGGDVILWSNSDGLGGADGNILLRNGSSITTNGGHLWMGGGSGTTSWNSLTVGDGYATAGAQISSNTSLGISAGTAASGIYLENTSINTDGGNFAAYGNGDNAGVERGILAIGDLTVTTGSGKIYLDAKSNDEISLIFGHHSTKTSSENVTITSSNTASDAITVNTVSQNSGSWSYGTWVEGTTTVQATNGGGIVWTTEGTTKGINLGYSTNSGIFNLLANSGDITLNTKAKGINIQSAGQINLGRLAGTSVTTSSSDITVIADDFASSGSNIFNFNTSGTVSITPQAGNSFASAFNTASLSYSSDVSGLTIGHSANTGDITIGSSTTIDGFINLYGDDITINNKLEATSSIITLDGSGTVSNGASGYVVASNLLLSDGSVTLNNTSNDIDNIAASGVDSLTFYDTDDIAIGSTIGGVTGISSTGNVVLNAGADESAGTSTGGDITVSGTPTISSTSGNVKLYTGSISGSTTLAALISAGNFRYNSDESSDGFTTSLGATGNYLLYREQPTLTVTATNDSQTYSGTAYSGGNGVTYSGFKNSDTSTYSLGGTLSYSGTSQTATEAGSYVITPSGYSSKLGYLISYVNGTLIITDVVTNFNNIITPIANRVIIHPRIFKNIVFKPIDIKPRNPVIMASSGNRVAVLSQPIANQNTRIVNMSELKSSNDNNSNISEDVIVPVGDNSVIDIINNGVNLPLDVEQVYFVSDDLTNSL